MKDSNLYITNLPKDISEEEIQKLFCHYGEIVQKSVLKDKITGMPRGVAFVRFVNFFLCNFCLFWGKTCCLGSLEYQEL